MQGANRDDRWEERVGRVVTVVGGDLLDRVAGLTSSWQALVVDSITLVNLFGIIGACVVCSRDLILAREEKELSLVADSFS